MKLRRSLLLLFAILLQAPLYAQDPQYPFPQHVHYAPGAIIPDHLSQKKLDKAVQSFYVRWKERYINSNCAKGQYYVWFEKKGNKQCVSEGQGYGMVITVLMAGYDKKAHETYDGLYRYYKAHPSKRDPHLMAWAQNANCKDLDGSSATDGDMDIAYSLLLANKQWGSAGAINYKQEALALTSSIMKQEINPKTFMPLLSNSVEYDSRDYFDTRSSDFMPANFKAFSFASRDVRWNKVVVNGYKLFKQIQAKYSPDAGLLPDFILAVNKKPKPARPKYLESPFDGCYSYNACRVPWRLATDYLIYADANSKAMVDRINTWIRGTTNDNPDNISAGYTLGGNDLKNHYFEAMSFIAPFAVAAMVDAKNQPWLNKMWDYIGNFNLDDFDYYDNSIKMLNMIILSGNYWPPK
jgi:endo-1,4-beta-D-glucanase Y